MNDPFVIWNNWTSTDTEANMSQPGEIDLDQAPTKWAPKAGEEADKKGDKPPKAGKKDKKKKDKKGKKPKELRENPDFEDIPGYEGSGFGKDTEFKPPGPAKYEGEPPEMKFPQTTDLSNEECRMAIIKFAEDHLCYGTKPAKEMQITKTITITALHYKLETFTESRSTKKKKKPYKGGFVDGPENGPAPGPWQMKCEPKKMFKDDKIKKEVPHTAKVKKCKDCKGKGYETCDECDGWGKEECNHCDGSAVCMIPDLEGNETEGPCPYCLGGYKMCLECGGDGRCTCDDCDGYGRLKCFIQLKVKYNNHDDDYVIETTDLPDHLVTKVGGIPLFQHEAPLVWPIAGYPLQEMNDNSAKMIDTHTRKWPTELILRQKHVLRGVPVTEVHYKWGDVNSRFWVYGTEKKVYAPDYPSQCCCGCSVL